MCQVFLLIYYCYTIKYTTSFCEAPRDQKGLPQEISLAREFKHNVFEAIEGASGKSMFEKNPAN